MASPLPHAARQRAANFIQQNATPLQQARFDYHFANGSADAVRDALLRFQNTDGGFGHGLEQDLRSENSSVICTTVGLQILEEVDTDIEHPQLKGGMAYLENAYQFGNWPLVNADNNDAPHAPWWTYDETWACTQKFLANPGAEVIGYVLQYGTQLPDKLIDRLLQRALEHIECNELEMHELLAYNRLFHNEYLGEPYRDALLPHLMREAFSCVKVDPLEWEEYGLKPTDLVTSPDSLFVDFFGDALDMAFTHQMDQQLSDGCWAPTWSWGEMFPATWRVVEAEIKAELTLRFLLQLQRFNLLEEE